MLKLHLISQKALFSNFNIDDLSNDEEEVLFADGTRPDAIFHSIGIDEHVAMSGCGIAGELRPAGQSVVDRLGESALGQDGRINARVKLTH